MMETKTAPTRESKTILIVEDSPVQALALNKLLEQEGLNVICASNGQAGIVMAYTYQPDLIIMDIQMPILDGLGACRLLKKNQATRNIPIVLFTAHNDAEIVRIGLDEGIIDFVPKDAFSDIVLLETLRQMNMLQRINLNGFEK